GAGRRRLTSENPNLVGCSLSSFGLAEEHAREVGHDLNFAALAGLLTLLPQEGLPRLQLADVTAGLLACNAILAALFRRARGGGGGWIDQPIASGPMPLLTWAFADVAGGGGGLVDALLGGACPAYRLYRCGDGKRIAVGALEPKFWKTFVDVLGLPDLSGAGLDPGPRGEETARKVQETLVTRPRAEWLALLAEYHLPVTAVHGLEDAFADPTLQAMKWFEETPVPGGGRRTMTAAFLHSIGASPGRPAPRLGEHSQSLAREFDLDGPDLPLP
ncbi:MAG: CoA transferase, partial [Acidobacteriota bacterium]|nr:CoA transferase [Acidobacteriota bacterium]